MEPAWKTRLRAAMKEQGLSAKSLGRAVGKNERLVYDLLEGTTNPRIDTLEAVARALGMSVTALWTGDESGRARVPITGAVAAGEAWTVFDDVLDDLELTFHGGDAIALEVRGDSMAPVYRNGDVIVGVKNVGRSPDNLIGVDCIVATEDGARYVKYLARGRTRGRYNLRSYNPANPDIEDVRIAWLAPICWIRRRSSS